jgi:hypothetical protein
MKQFILTLLLITVRLILIACPTCERQQPKLLRGILHGTGPDSKWDYLIVSATIVIVISTLYFSIKWLIKPGEKNNEHIKYFILNAE